MCQLSLWWTVQNTHSLSQAGNPGNRSGGRLLGREQVNRWKLLVPFTAILTPLLAARMHLAVDFNWQETKSLAKQIFKCLKTCTNIIISLKPALFMFFQCDQTDSCVAEGQRLETGQRRKKFTSSHWCLIYNYFTFHFNCQSEPSAKVSKHGILFNISK